MSLTNPIVVVGQAGTNRVSGSVDGITWDLADTISAQSWNGVCWSPELGIYCAVAGSGVAANAVATSSDGVTWTSHNASEALTLSSVCWSPELSLFVATSSTGTNRVMTSPNGTTWTSRSAAEQNAWQTVCWSAALRLFCAVSTNGTHRVMTSPDGITWTAQTQAGGATGYANVCWSPKLGLFCAVNGANVTNAVMTSPDGVNWTQRTTGTANTWGWVCWSQELSKFCAIGGFFSMTSPDGITWTRSSSQGDNNWAEVCWFKAGALFAAAGGAGVQMRTSTDGLTWTTRTVPNGQFSSVIAANPTISVGKVKHRIRAAKVNSPINTSLALLLGPAFWRWKRMSKMAAGLVLVGGLLFGNQKSARISVSAVVRPAAVLRVQSPEAVTVGVTMYPNASALVWPAAGSCGAPDNAKTISSSGISQLSFTPSEVEGKDRVCLVSSDGVLKTSALF